MEKCLDVHRGRASLLKGAWIFMKVEPIADGVILPSNHISGYKETWKSLNNCHKWHSIG